MIQWGISDVNLKLAKPEFSGVAVPWSRCALESVCTVTGADCTVSTRCVLP